MHFLRTPVIYSHEIYTNILLRMLCINWSIYLYIYLFGVFFFKNPPQETILEKKKLWSFQKSSFIKNSKIVYKFL